MTLQESCTDGSNVSLTLNFEIIRHPLQEGSSGYPIPAAVSYDRAVRLIDRSSLLFPAEVGLQSDRVTVGLADSTGASHQYIFSTSAEPGARMAVEVSVTFVEIPGLMTPHHELRIMFQPEECQEPTAG